MRRVALCKSPLRDFLTPTPFPATEAEHAEQAGKASTDDGAGNRRRAAGHGKSVNRKSMIMVAAGKRDKIDRKEAY